MATLFKFAVVALAITALAAQAGATPQDRPVADCSGKTAGLPPELGGWTARSAATAAADGAGLDGAAIQLGRRTEAALHKTRDVNYVTRPEKPGASVSHGGMFVFTVSEAGTYRVALGSKAWIDVLKADEPVASSAHGHGPDCSGIRKMVDFPLTPGRHVLQLAGSDEPSIAVLVAKLP